jgi:hypothetical protein
MARKKFIAILLHLIIVTVGVTICDDESLINSNINSTALSEADDGQVMVIRDNWEQMECMKRMCPINEDARQIHIALLLPSTPQNDQINTQTLSAILPVIDHAIKKVHNLNLLNGYELVIHPRDTKCSSTVGPLAAFDLHSREHADVFLGPICDYVLAPVARYAGVWGKPVISTGGQAAAFNFKVSVSIPAHARAKAEQQILLRVKVGKNS